MQRGPSPRRPPGRTSGARKADAQPGRAAGRGPPGPWAPARRCSRLTTVLHLEPPQTELPSEATSLGWKPGCALVQSLLPHRAAAPATRLPPHHRPLGCGPPFCLPVWLLDAGHPSSSRAPGRAEVGHQDAAWPAELRHFVHLPEAGHVRALQGLKSQCLGLGSLSFSSCFSRRWSWLSPPHVRMLFHHYA